MKSANNKSGFIEKYNFIRKNGYIISESGEKLYFDENSILDKKLLKSLYENKTTANDEFTILKNKIIIKFESYKQAGALMAASIEENTEEYAKDNFAYLNMKVGTIISYDESKKTGFIKSDDIEYLFEEKYIEDEDLKNIINSSAVEKIKVNFSDLTTNDIFIATEIITYRSVGEWAKFINYSHNNVQYLPFISSLICLILKSYPSNSRFINFKNKLCKTVKKNEQENSYLVAGFEQNFFDLAQKAKTEEKNNNKAIELYDKAIEHGQNAENAIKNKSSIIAEYDPEKAIEYLKENVNNISNIFAYNNLLLSFLDKAKKYREAIDLIENTILPSYQSEINTIYTLSQYDKTPIISLNEKLSLYYYRNENYSAVIDIIDKLTTDYLPAYLRTSQYIVLRRRMAMSYIKLKKLSKAEEILDSLIRDYADNKSYEILHDEIYGIIEPDSKDSVKDKYAFGEDDGWLNEYDGSQFELQILNSYTEFFNEQNDIFYDNHYTGTQDSYEKDIESILNPIKENKNISNRDKAMKYLSAAKILFDIKSNKVIENNEYYIYITNALFYMAEHNSTRSVNPDSLRTFYIETLRCFDKIDKKVQENYRSIACRSLVKLIYSISDLVVCEVNNHPENYEKSLDFIITKNSNKTRIFDFLVFLITNSIFAADSILNYIYQSLTCRAHSLNYFKEKYNINEINVSPEKFKDIWTKCRKEKLKSDYEASQELKMISSSKIIFNHEWFEHLLNELTDIKNKLFMGLDIEILEKIQTTILGAGNAFDSNVISEQIEMILERSENKLKDILNGIKNTPTRFMLESGRKFIEKILSALIRYKDDLHKRSQPDIKIQLLRENFSVISNNFINLQFRILNNDGCSPAKIYKIEIMHNSNEQDNSVVHTPKNSLISGGCNSVEEINLKLTEKIIEEKAFTLKMIVYYTNIFQEQMSPQVFFFSIKLYDEESNISTAVNPYTATVRTNGVTDKKMFFGREAFINRIHEIFKNSNEAGKCLILYGQRRAGKTSILIHLIDKFKSEGGFIVIDIGNYARLFENEKESKVPYLWILLWAILSNLKNSIRCFPDFPKVDFPKSKEFLTHPSPQLFFNEIMDEFKYSMSLHEKYRHFKPIIIIDEFSVIYNHIKTGKLSGDFMKVWKAMLQSNYFNAIITGQYLMIKLKNSFPNELGVAQTEKVGCLSHEFATALMEVPIRRIDERFRYLENSSNMIFELTDGNPFYIQIFCNRLFDYMKENKIIDVTEADIFKVKKYLMREKVLTIDCFENLVFSEDESKDTFSHDDVWSVLKDISFNSQDGNQACLYEDIKSISKTTSDMILNELVNMDVLDSFVNNKNKFYKIRVGLFKEFILNL